MANAMSGRRSAVEERMQSECFRWFWNEYPSLRRMLFHVDNNSWNQIIGARKKALGVVAGVSDMIFIVESAVWFLEAKTEDGVQSQEQIDFMEKVMMRGHQYRIFRNLQQFKDIIWSIIGK